LNGGAGGHRRFRPFRLLAIIINTERGGEGEFAAEKLNAEWKTRVRSERIKRTVDRTFCFWKKTRGNVRTEFVSIFYNRSSVGYSNNSKRSKYSNRRGFNERKSKVRIIRTRPKITRALHFSVVYASLLPAPLPLRRFVSDTNTSRVRRQVPQTGTHE